MKSKKLCKADIEYKLQNYLTNELGVDKEYYVKLSRKKDSTKLGDLPETRPFGVDVNLAHKIYNWGFWKGIQAHKVINHFLIAYGGDILDLAPERPKDADNFAMRYNKAKNPSKLGKKNPPKRKMRTLKRRAKK